MRLKRLVVHGFKSFKDRTIIHFDDGITGIVGPNGCGKSNIVDALFWVMGEQSAKHLRGNTMKDVIFAGSSKYNPGQWAEVTLVLDNEEGKHVHIGNKVSNPTEIQLTRKIYRNGETEYRLNDSPCRLKDIQEVFMDTGAGAKSYSIIAQGEINRLVQAKPEERRVMIEEVAGITKYKIRKRDSLKKIEQAQSNLGRLQDLQSEIEKHLKSLRSQAEKAEKARVLKEKVKRNEIIVNSHKVHDHLKDLKEGSTKVEEMEQSNQTWAAQKDNLEASLENERIMRDELTEKCDELSKERNEISKNLAAKEERLSGLCSQQTEKEKLIETRQKEILDLTQELDERRDKLAKLFEQRENLESEGEEVDFSDLEEKVETLKENLELKEERIRDLGDEVQEKKEELHDIQRKIFQNTSKTEEYAANVQDMTAEIEELEKKFSGVSVEISQERESVKKSQNNFFETEKKLADIKDEVSQLSEEKEERTVLLHKKNEELIQAQAHLSSLQEIQETMDGPKSGTQEFFSQYKGDEIALLGNLIKCDEKYTKIVQSLLAPYLHLIVCQEGKEKEVFEWAKTHQELPLDILLPKKNSQALETKKELEKRFSTPILSFEDIIEVPLRFESSLIPLLSQFFIISHFDLSTSSLNLPHNIGGIVDSEGNVFYANSNAVEIIGHLGTEENSSNGMIARNNKIQELTEKVEIYKNELDGFKKGLEEIQSLLKEKKEDEENLRNEMIKAQADFITKETALKSKLENMSSGSERLNVLTKRKDEISQKRLELLEEEENLLEIENELKDFLDNNQNIFEELKDEIADLRALYEREREDLLEKQMESKSFQNRLNQLEENIQDIEKQVNKQKDRIQSYESQVRTYKNEVEEIQGELEQIEHTNQELVLKLEEKDEVLSELKDQLSELLLNMQARENDVKELTSSINKNEKEISTLTVKMAQALNEEEQVTRNIFEKYQIDLRKSVGSFLEFEQEDYENLNDITSVYIMESENGPLTINAEEYTFHRRYGQDLKECQDKFKQYRAELNRLGDINWQAVEDYERQKLRFDFLKEQEEELKKSLEDLQEAISHIDVKSRERFKAAFKEVSSRFEKVFPIIFGGGSAKLNLTGDIDDLDAGVDIIAQPPGKKMQNINLMSGGEKAMTAVSLIFSIFLVKPSPFCLLDEVDAPLDDANVGRFNELLREMSSESQFILITHNKKTMELNDTLYGVTMQEPGISKAVSVQLH